MSNPVKARKPSKPATTVKSQKKPSKTSVEPDKLTTPKYPPRVTVTVTQSDIDTGIKTSGSHCMIADAIKRNVPNASHVIVDAQTIRWTNQKKGLRYVYLTPLKAIVPLLRFDVGRPVQPFQFGLKKGQVLSSRMKGNKAKLAHKLGQKRISTNKNGTVNIVGGTAPPVQTGSHRREFGKRQLLKEDVYGDQPPTL